MPWWPLAQLVRLSHLWYMPVTLELYGAVSGSRATMLMFVFVLPLVWYPQVNATVLCTSSTLGCWQWSDMEGLVASVYLVWSALLVLYWLWCMHGCVDLATAV